MYVLRSNIRKLPIKQVIRSYISLFLLVAHKTFKKDIFLNPNTIDDIIYRNAQHPYKSYNQHRYFPQEKSTDVVHVV